MQFGIHANVYDQSTSNIAKILQPIFRELGNQLEGEYGGVMEHLWVDLELVECWSREDGKSRHPFRFQKRVSGRSRFGFPPSPDSYNVGHFSVRPDYAFLASLPTEQITPYILSLIHKNSAVLLDKKKKLGSFNAEMFRLKFLQECQALGYPISA